MRHLIVFLFILFALLTAGILTTALSYVRIKNKEVTGSFFWLISIICSLVGLCFFSLGTAITEDDLRSSSFVFTLANILYLASVIFHVLFCISLVKKVSKNLLLGACLFIFVLGVHFEIMRGSGNFNGRVIEVATVVSILYLVQIYYLLKLLKLPHPRQIRFLMLFTFIDFVTVIVRLLIVIEFVSPILSLASIPLLLLAAVSLNLLFTALSYLAMLGFWAERADANQIRVENESKRVTSLLKERESLIRSLMKLNRSAVAGALSASIAHEINQPVGALTIDLYNIKKILKEKKIEDPNISEILARMESDNQRIGGVIHSVRGIFVAQNTELEFSNLRQVITAVTNLAQDECNTNKISLLFDIPDINVVGNQIQLQQVFLNLLNNAIHALKKINNPVLPKHIIINASQFDENHIVHVSVEDNGSGISLEKVDNIFKLFNSNNKDGLGIGLWLSQEIMKRLGGSVSFVTCANGGAKFIVAIPLQPISV